MEKTAPETKIPTAASSDQKNRSLPYPKGCVSSAGLRLTRKEISRKIWLVVSATECAPSASIALEPLSSPAVILATAMPRLAASATRTVPVLSSSLTGKVYPGRAAAVWKSGAVATVLLVRHGLTAMTGPVLAGHTRGPPLEGRGRAQAAAGAERLRPVPLAAVVSSPLERCAETAAAVTAGRDGLAVRTEPRLAEVRYGDWTGRALKELAK